MNAKATLAPTLLGLAMFVVPSVYSQEKGVAEQTRGGAAKSEEGHSAAAENKRFLDPKLDVESYVKRFESDRRELFAMRNEIVAAVGVKTGQSVADVGAGTGLFTFLFADRVGPTGKVYAVDISPAFLKYIDEQANKRKLADVVHTIHGAQDATNLPPHSVDFVFVCATYHHFERPAKILASMRTALRDDGHLVVIDFDRERGGAFAQQHARAKKEVYFSEIEAAGFVRVETPAAPPLKDDFFAVFRVSSIPPKPLASPQTPSK